MSARRFARLGKEERNKIIDQTDEVFARRTGITRRINPKTEEHLVRQWISIRDELMARPGRAPASRVSNGMMGKARQGISRIVEDVQMAASHAGNVVNTLATPVPRWIQIARTQLGQREFAGSSFNPRILQYILTCRENFETGNYSWADKKKNDWQAWVREKRASGLMIPNRKPTNQLKYLLDGEGRGANDEGFYWCAAFVNWCLRSAGQQSRNHGLVRRWKNWGTRIDEPVQGAILIKKRGKDSWGHIAFVDRVNGQWKMLGGNQTSGNAGAVTSATYPSKSALTALIWPKGVALPSEAK